MGTEVLIVHVWLPDRRGARQPASFKHPDSERKQGNKGNTEHRVAEAIKSDYSFLTDNPHFISLLALFQERDNFEVDVDQDIVKPIQEEGFLQIISKDISDMENLPKVKGRAKIP